MKLPQHVGIIMDGNGRWAKARGLRRLDGHTEGLSTAQKTIEYAAKKGIKYLSLYVFSTENWKRPKAEISALFSLADKYLDNFLDFCKNSVRVVVSGQKDRLPAKLCKKIEEIEQKTAAFSTICVNLCISYGGREDVCQAARSLVENGLEITEENLSKQLYNGFLPDPDLIIRTGGEMRLSNFLLYQSAYAELYFTKTLWPDFSFDEFDTILENYCNRTRNFGNVVE